MSNPFMPDRAQPVDVRSNGTPGELDIGPDGKGGTPPDFAPLPTLPPYGNDAQTLEWKQANVPHLDGTDALMAAAGSDYTGLNMLDSHAEAFLRG